MKLASPEFNHPVTPRLQSAIDAWTRSKSILSFESYWRFEIDDINRSPEEFRDYEMVMLAHAVEQTLRDRGF